MNSISIIINNYNYEKYLGDAIDSALNQTVSAKEVIVIDDGSTDGSRSIINSYGPRVISVFKENGGQASAFNSGYLCSTGDWVLYLDADDFLYENAIETLLKYVSVSCARIEFQLDIVDGEGRYLGSRNLKLCDGDPLEKIQNSGRLTINPTSSHLFSRKTLQSCLPLPEEKFRVCADLGLIVRASAHGRVIPAPVAVAAYRVHGENLYASKKNNTSYEISRRHVQNALFLRSEVGPIMHHKGKVMPPDFGYRSMELIESLRRIQLIGNNELQAGQILSKLPKLYIKGLSKSFGPLRKARAIALCIYSLVVARMPIKCVNCFSSLRVTVGIS